MAKLDTLARIEAVRTKIEAAKARRDEIRTAPLPRAETIALIRATIERQAREWRASIHLGAVAAYPPGQIGMLRIDDIPPAAFAPEAVEAALVAALDELLATNPPGLPARERPAALAQLDAEILDLEVSEEQLIVDAERIGHAIDRRADADPRAVLAVA